ncbi:MAG: hypothetical protein AAFZ15_24205 [Bacteroidota bacterium]
MIKDLISILAIGICLSSLSCINPEYDRIEFSDLEVETISANIEGSTATVEGAVTFFNLRTENLRVRQGIVWSAGLNPSPTVMDEVQAIEQFVNDDFLISEQLTNLQPGIRYFARSFVEVEGTQVYGEPLSFIFNWGNTDFQNPNLLGRSNANALVLDEQSIYLTLGNDANNILTDTWLFNGSEWSFVNADFGGSKRTKTVGFALQDKVYVGLGTDSFGNLLDDFFHLDGDSNWAPSSTFPTGGREGAVTFTLGNRAYIGMGKSFSNFYDDLYAFEEGGGWAGIAISGGPSARSEAISFTIGDIAYVGLGKTGGMFHNDFYAFRAVPMPQWTKVADFPDGGRIGTVSFVINGRGYIALGVSEQGVETDIYEYRPEDDSWSLAGTFPGAPRANAVAFAIGNQAIIGLGNNNELFFNDWWGFTPEN